MARYSNMLNENQSNKTNVNPTKRFSFFFFLIFHGVWLMFSWYSKITGIGTFPAFLIHSNFMLSEFIHTHWIVGIQLPLLFLSQLISHNIVSVLFNIYENINYWLFLSCVFSVLTVAAPYLTFIFLTDSGVPKRTE